MSDKSVHERLCEALDKTILDVLENGMPVQDESGNVQRIPPNAAFINAAIRWADRRDGKNGGGESEADPMTAMMKQLQQGQQAGGRMPEVDVEGEDAAA